MISSCHWACHRPLNNLGIVSITRDCLWIRQPGDNAAPRDRMISCMKFLTHVSHVHCSPAQTKFIATITRMHIGKHAICSTTFQNGDNYLKVGHLMPPERPLNRQLVGDRAPLRRLAHTFTTRASIPMVTSDAGLFYLYFAHSTSSLFKLTMTAAAVRESFIGGREDRTWARWPRLAMLFPRLHCV